MSEDVKKARYHLYETLGHWKDGTRPGDSDITDGDVTHAIHSLIDACIAAAVAALEGKCQACNGTGSDVGRYPVQGCQACDGAGRALEGREKPECTRQPGHHFADCPDCRARRAGR